MNTKKWLIAALGVFIAYFAMEFVVHGVIMKPLYEQTASVWRPEEYMRKLMLWMMAGQAIFSVMFVLIYAKGYEPTKGWLGQGLRFGLILGTLLAPIALTEYVVYPVAGLLALKWILFGYVQVILSALVAAGLYRP